MPASLPPDARAPAPLGHHLVYEHSMKHSMKHSISIDILYYYIMMSIALLVVRMCEAEHILYRVKNLYNSHSNQPVPYAQTA
jgi:hypothetical protein